MSFISAMNEYAEFHADKAYEYDRYARRSRSMNSTLEAESFERRAKYHAYMHTFYSKWLDGDAS